MDNLIWSEAVTSAGSGEEPELTRNNSALVVRTYADDARAAWVADLGDVSGARGVRVNLEARAAVESGKQPTVTIVFWSIGEDGELTFLSAQDALIVPNGEAQYTAEVDVPDGAEEARLDLRLWDGTGMAVFGADASVFKVVDDATEWPGITGIVLHHTPQDGESFDITFARKDGGDTKITFEF